MKVRLRVSVTDVGKDGETKEVPDEQGAWLINGGYAVQVESDNEVAQEDSLSREDAV